MKSVFTLLLAFTTSLSLFSQRSYGSFPYSLGKSGIYPVNATFKLNPINNEILLQEDELLAELGEKSLRFGLDVPVDISPSTHGEWKTLENGLKLWRLKIKSNSALSLNFIFDRFSLPQGAKLFIFSPDGNVVKGAYTKQNENKLNNFATLPIVGNELVIEYSEPANATGTLDLHISYIVHGYRNFNSSLKDFGDSGNCNNNVVCPVGDDWNAQKRSIVMLLTSNNSRFCSGAAINNTANDGTPYILGANHCDIGATDIFMFNYFSPTCTPNADGSTSDIVIGCTPRANRANSDFALVELSEEIPVEYEAFLSGWSRQDAAPANSTSIHHPAGDVMKITFNTDLTDVEQYSGADCWHIPDWEDGTTEGGSSGSPLYNENKQIIGQLYGGTANCSNNVDDYYGRFITSWDGPAANRRLKDWLDPNNTNQQSIDGIEASAPTLALDVRLQSIISPVEEYCNVSTITPEIRVRNGGIQAITSFTIQYSWAGGTPQQQAWTGNLLSNQSINITLPDINVSAGNAQSFVAEILSPNNTIDNDLSNNSNNITFDVGSGEEFRLQLVSDNYPEETSWILRNSLTGEIISNVGLGNVTQGTSIENWCLPAGCYSFVIRDDYGDGICCGFFSGNGSFTVYDSENQVLGSGGNFSYSDSVNFCTDSTLSFNDLFETNELTIYPNPNNGLVNLSFNKEPVKAYVVLFDLRGRAVYSETIYQKNHALRFTSVDSGSYILKVTTSGKTISKRIIIAK